MGLFPSPPQLAMTPSSSEFDTSDNRHLVKVSFCHREPKSNPNISNWIECYNPSNNTWSHVSFIPNLIENHVLKGFAMVSLGEKIYIVGGQLWEGRPKNSSESDDLVYTRVEVSPLVLCYDVQSDQRSTCAPLRISRYDFACTVYDNKIYVARGKSNLASTRGISFTKVYDPETNMWTPLPNMSTLRYKCMGVTWQWKIHVVGGFAETKGDVEFNMLTRMKERSLAEMYNTHARKWEIVSGMWQLDVPPNQIVNVKGKLFGSGDYPTPWKRHIEAYNGKLWDEVAGSRYQINSRMSDFGGSDENLSQLECVYLTMAPIGSHLYFLAGYRMGGASS